MKLAGQTIKVFCFVVALYVRGQSVVSLRVQRVQNRDCFFFLE